MKEARKWITVARDAFHYDMGVMTAKERSIYRAFIELDDRLAYDAAFAERCKQIALTLLEALKTISKLATPPDKISPGIKLDEIYDIASAAIAKAEWKSGPTLVQRGEERRREEG